ncbi:helix-turn-helix domain-containing protein [Streptomyces sp. NPDC056486]|uniref:helix-turn-helix domain-containing protein n=1 Tax=Streptomyces sp. NPDC056486 TaxID=3345835 RepID=UPI00368D40AA
MTEVNSQPPMAWRYCGNQVKRWREQAGTTREELCKETGYHYEYVKSMENGRRKPTLRLLQIADEMCDAHGLLLSAQDYLKPEPFPARSQEFMQIEAEAISLLWYEPLLIPGLLQTEEYARTLISESCPPLDDETVEERVGARLRRQEALRARPSVVFNFVVYEAALRTMVGGREATKRQLQHILEASQLRNVSVQVLPMGRCSGLALTGSVVLLETPEHEHYAYSEVQTTSALYADTAKVSELTQRHGMIRLHALSVEESADFIRKMAEEL